MGPLETIISVITELWQKCYNWLDYYFFFFFTQKPLLPPTFDESAPEINQTDTCNEDHLGSPHSNELIPQTLSGHVLPEHTQFIMYLQGCQYYSGLLSSGTMQTAAFHFFSAVPLCCDGLKKSLER